MMPGVELDYVSDNGIYTVYRMEDPQGTWALKVPSSYVNNWARFFSRLSRGTRSMLWSRITTTGSPAGPAGEPDRQMAISLLGDEAARIHASRGMWNHEVRWFQPFEVYGEMKWALCTRWFEGTRLDKLPRDEARRVFPLMLPALWKALAIAAHGDLHAGNIIVGEQRFALIDPGAMVLTEIDGVGGSGSTTLDLITHAIAYPVLPPFATQVPAGTRLRAAWNLWLDNISPQRPVPNDRPLPGDLHALGVLYYKLLADRDPYPLAVERGPAWSGLENFDHQIRTGTLLGDLVTSTTPPRPSTFDSSITPREDELAMALLDLALDSTDDVMRF